MANDRQGPSMGKSQQGIPKDFNAGITEKELKRRNQGTLN